MEKGATCNKHLAATRRIMESEIRKVNRVNTSISRKHSAASADTLHREWIALFRAASGRLYSRSARTLTEEACSSSL